MQLFRQPLLDYGKPAFVGEFEMLRQRAEHHRIERFRIGQLIHRHIVGGDQHAARFELVAVDFNLSRLHHDQEVAFAFRNHRAGDFFAVAHFAGNGAAALAHAVHFALFHIESGAEHHFRDDVGDGQHALAAETGDGDIDNFLHLISSLRKT